MALPDVNPGCSPTGICWGNVRQLDDGSRMSGDVHVRFCERLGVKFPRATHLVLGFARQDDAVRMLEVLHKRMSKYGLTLHPDKTRLIPFKRPRTGENGRSGPGTFNFLGFTMYWCRTRRGGWRLGMKTRKARIQRALAAHGDWCRRHPGTCRSRISTPRSVGDCAGITSTSA